VGDVDQALPAPRAAHPAGGRWSRSQAAVLGAVTAGGVAGACLRYGASLLWPTHPGAFPTTTLGINAVGCAAMGVLMAVITAVPSAHPLARPFLGTGVLGGFTTFSTYALDAQRLLDAGRAGTALAYLAATVAAALGAVTIGYLCTRAALRALPRLALRRSIEAGGSR
jgi:CrcB protein